MAWPWYTDSGTNENDVPIHDLGRQTLGVNGGSGTPFCSVWQAAREAVTQYRRVTGSPLPYGRLVIRGGAPNAGVPFSLYTTIMWQTNFGPAKRRPVDENGAGVAYHEFGHTLRHAFDGTLDHFTDDVVGYIYAQHHSARDCERTNLGFAFNEGWADYWEWQAKPPQRSSLLAVDAAQCPPGDDFGIEANVARALVKLDLQCRNDTPAAFVRTLRRSDGDIHSYVEFEDQVPLGHRPV